MKTLTFLASLFLSTHVLASGFTAVCKADKTHAYRNSTDISGNEMGAEWSDTEKFSGNWTFAFQGGENLEVDGKLLPILFWNGIVMVAIDHNASDMAVSTWTYAINLDLEDIVGSQVNAYRTMGTGIKARSVNFICEFTRHAETQ